jgi:hypothetical protein
MRANRVVVGAPCFDAFACVIKTGERMLIQTFFAQSPIEAFDVRVFDGLARPDELQPHAVFVRPGIERLADEFRSVVDLYQLWPSPVLAQLFKHACNSGAGEREIHFDARAFTIPCVDNGQHPYAPAIDERIGHKVHCPALVGGVRNRKHRTQMARPLFAPPLPKRQAFFAVQALGPLVVRHQPFSLALSR